MGKEIKSDISIANAAKLKKIDEIVAMLDIAENEWEPYGRYKAKLSLDIFQRLQEKKDAQVILVTSINPTPAREGKSTVTVGLGQALHKLGKKAIIALREPSLGPTMGMKGGASGGGYSQVMPMEEINLHFTGDFHAITAANNALAAFIDNHIYQGNECQIDPRRIVWKRVLDQNDRALRQVIVGLGGPFQGVPREDGFQITVASEIMAVLCLARDISDLKARLARIVVAYTYEREPVTVADLKVEGALTLLLKDALKPNLVQTLENTPALIHGGPFANIAHGCNSIIATKMACKLGDYVVTEAGFGADLGAEKFLNIKARYGEIKPSATVIVATVRALKMHGGVDKADLASENLPALEQGMDNLAKHIETVRSFGLPVVVAINRFQTDTAVELALIKEWCLARQVRVALADVWAQGGEGGLELAKELLKVLAEEESQFKPLYPLEATLTEKIKTVAQKVYGADDVQFTPKAEKQIAEFNQNGWGDLPVCMAKTQYSLSDDPRLVGRPENFSITVRELSASIGAGFIVALTGEMLTMPGLPKKPAALNMDVDEEGRAQGLF